MKIDFYVTVYNGVKYEYVKLARGRVQWCVLLYTVMNFGISQRNRTL